MLEIVRRFNRFLLIAGITTALSACLTISDTTLRVGEPAPSLKTKTLADVDGDFSRITTYRYPDERMYQYSIDDALTQGKPVIVEFATPGHCTVCDKQLQVLKGILNKYESEIIIVHMDQYQNPEAFIEYKVTGDPWTFVIDKNQKVVFKRAGRLLYNEIDLALQPLLAAQS
ncbi:MAG: thioredoxin family protein [Gammaproteobacteria bacterium]|nr:thioredoxin family protein [Gammaproteobacteria bacterium]